MATFIRVIEIWTPSKSGKELVFDNGIYGHLEGFSQNSRKEKFSYGEGLPGKAWEMAKPIVLKSFDNSSFLRKEIAHEVGLTSGIAIPIFLGDNLNAVLVFLCGDEIHSAGAIEVWRDDGLSGMSLNDGYYGDLKKFEWLSNSIKFPRGRGLPGIVWETGLPVVMGNLANSNSFLRSNGAAEAKITTSIGIPYYSSEEKEDIDSVITFLSSDATPIAKRFEVWRPDTSSGCLLFENGIQQGCHTVEEPNTFRFIKKGDGTIGGVWQTGIPGISIDVKSEMAGNGFEDEYKSFNSLLAIPIIHNKITKSVVVFYN